MKIALTGANGFIGSEVIHMLKDYSDVEIVALTRRYKEMDNAVTWKLVDYSIESLKEAISGVDVVIHLAAVRGVGGCIADYHTNEIITEKLLQAMVETNVKKIVFASSIAVYSDINKIPWKENDVVTPKTLYGITKLACEYLCMYYAKRYDLTYVILRIAQVLGENETKRGMMNTFINHAYEKKELVVHGKSIAKRQFIYVRDLAHIITQFAIKDTKRSEILNVGMEKAYTNLEIAETVNRVFENNAGINYENNCPENIEASCMDPTKYMELLQEKPRDMENSLKDIKRRMDDVSECC